MQKVRKALLNISTKQTENIDFDKPIYEPFKDSHDIVFVEEFKKAGGKFVFCESIHDFQIKLISFVEEMKWEYLFCLDKNIQKLLKEAKVPFKYSENLIPKAKVGITRCEYLVARFGSIVVSSKGGSGRRLYAFPETHIVMAYSSQVVPEIQDALSNLKQKYSATLPSSISVITGPSRTADIEKTLVMGAHGPINLYVFLLDKD